MKEIHSYDFDKEITVCIGASDSVIIDKLYGPLCALDVKVELDFSQGEWVVYRERPVDNSPTMEWVEVVRWNCQLDWWKDEDEAES